MGTKSDTSENRKCPEQPKGRWRENIIKSMHDPNLVVFEDEFTITIKDLYPKASHHYLVCCKENIKNLKCVLPKHVDLLKHMHKVAEKIAEMHKGKNFLIGYHSIPIMVRLHLHVISDDFDSPCLKTKKHWNSFTTKFFFPSERVIKELELYGNVIHASLSEAKKLKRTPLKCHKCDYAPQNMPELKSHIKTHFA